MFIFLDKQEKPTRTRSRRKKICMPNPKSTKSKTPTAKESKLSSKKTPGGRASSRTMTPGIRKRLVPRSEATSPLEFARLR